MNIREVIPIIEKKGFRLKKCTYRKMIYFNGEQEIVLAKCSCSAVSENEDKEKMCKENNDIYLLPDGKVSLCRNSAEEIDLYEEIKNKKEDKLIEKIERIIHLTGKGCKC